MASDGWREIACPVARRKLVVLVPHPDDEIFGCAGLLQEWSKEASETFIIYVTSGEASHGYQTADEKAELARIRRLESQKALAELELGTPLQVKELHIPDSNVQGFQDELLDSLRLELDSNSIVIAPYYDDGHADHNAVGDCARKLAAEMGFEIHFYPIWLWFWAKPEAKDGAKVFRKLSLRPEEQQRKVRAIDCFESQIIPSPQRAAVIPEEFLQHYRNLSFEVLVN